MPHIFKLSAVLASAFILSACEPAFETTAQKCAAGQELEILISVVDPKYQVLANDRNNDYELYLRKALEAINVATASSGHPETVAAKAFIDSKIEEFLDYNFDAINTNEVSDALNPVDFLENLIATTDPDLEIESFVRAKALVAQATVDDDDFCAFKNRNIRLVDGNSPDLDDIGYGEFAISYDPFNKIVQQSIIFSKEASDLESSAARSTIPYAGFFQALPANFKAKGFTTPQLRQLIANNNNKYEQLSFDEGTDTELGQIILDYNNGFCDENPTKSTGADGKEIITYDDCGAGIPTRTPSTHVGGVCDSEENKYSDHSFDLNSGHTDLKRLRVEVDYSAEKEGEVRIYGSQYREAIYGADDDGINKNIIIADPTPCEKQAVLDALYEALPDDKKASGDGVRLTAVPDANYDITYQIDANGDPVLDGDGKQIIDAEPIPLYTFSKVTQMCAEGQDQEVLISVVDPKYQVLANDPGNDYELYLRKVLEAMHPDTALVDPDTIAARAFIDSKIEAFLDYNFDAINTNKVSDAINPVDFLENLVATKDPDLEIESFVRAKALVAQTIADGDHNFCSFVNRNIRLVDGNSPDLDDLGYGEFAISYNPFTKIVQQSIIFSEVASDLDSSAARSTIPYAGFFQATPANFKAKGFTTPEIRQLIANNDLKYEQLSFDEGTDTELGQIILDYNNGYCDEDPTSSTDADGNVTITYDDCGAGIPVRTPSTEIGGVCDSEANQYSDYDFDLSPSDTDLKRLRVEVDYSTAKAGEVRIYGSPYREAIYAADGTTEIFDPTPCEKQAVLDQLFDALPDDEKATGGVRLTLVPDINYDITYQDSDMDGEDDLDSDGNRIEIEPTPLHAYQGTAP